MYPLFCFKSVLTQFLMIKLFFCICLLQLGYLLKSMCISLQLIMSVSVTLDTLDTNSSRFCLVKITVNVLKI